MAMTSQEATQIVVNMARARDEGSPEGEALRIMLRELRERRGEAIDLAKAVDRMNGQLEGVSDEEE